MSRKNYTVDEVLHILKKKQDVHINASTKSIQILNGAANGTPKQDDLGNGSWGKIDYLVKYQGFSQYNVAKFDKTL